MTEPLSGQIDKPEAEREVAEIVAAAGKLGVELDAQEAIQWIIAVSAAERENAFAQDAQTGVFGNRISLIDFDPDNLAYFRRLAQRVRIERRTNIESAIAIAGSSAQGKVQLFPGDTDFFERVNIRADTEAAARQVLREVMRETALRAFSETGIVLLEVNFGVYPVAVVERGVPRAAGDSITWTPADVLQGHISVATSDGAPSIINWADAQSGLGWSYLGWIIADRTAGRIALASNMLDVTWEAPDGHMVALDGALDPFFQEIYLEPEAVPVFSKIIRNADQGALKTYINAMRWQAFHYTHVEPNYGKAAKRLYNLFRLTDQLEAAAYVRELFDEPRAALYQVPGLLDAIDAARGERSGIDRDTVISQIDQVIRAIIISADGKDAADLVMSLIQLRDQVLGRNSAATNWPDLLGSVRRQCYSLVNEFFRARLLALPSIEQFIAQLSEPA